MEIKAVFRLEAQSEPLADCDIHACTYNILD